MQFTQTFGLQQVLVLFVGKAAVRREGNNLEHIRALDASCQTVKPPLPLVQLCCETFELRHCYFICMCSLLEAIYLVSILICSRQSTTAFVTQTAAFTTMTSSTARSPGLIRLWEDNWTPSFIWTCIIKTQFYELISRAFL